MARYTVEVKVEFSYEVEADSYEDAEKMGWEYEDYMFTAQVASIDVTEEEEEEDEEEESEE